MVRLWTPILYNISIADELRRPDRTRHASSNGVCKHQPLLEEKLKITSCKSTHTRTTNKPPALAERRNCQAQSYDKSRFRETAQDPRAQLIELAFRESHEAPATTRGVTSAWNRTWGQRLLPQCHHNATHQPPWCFATESQVRPWDLQKKHWDKRKFVRKRTRQPQASFFSRIWRSRVQETIPYCKNRFGFRKPHFAHTEQHKIKTTGIPLNVFWKKSKKR